MHLPAKAATRLIDRGWLRWPTQTGGKTFDVAHATSLLVTMSRRHGPPSTVFVHDLAWRTQPSSFPRRGVRWHEHALQRAIRRADHFITPSSATADSLRRAGVSAANISVAPEGCDHLPIKERRPGDYLLSVSTLEPRKNLRRLVEAYALSGVRLPLKIVGPTGWGTALREVPSGVELVGRVDDDELASLYAGARLLAYVPLEEGFGLPAVEAMRAGCPVVASSIPKTRGGADSTMCREFRLLALLRRPKSSAIPRERLPAVPGEKFRGWIAARQNRDQHVLRR